MKRIFLLSFFVQFFISPTSVICATYTALEEDIERSKTMSLISGANIEDFKEKAVITLGCHNHKFHTKVIFEIMEEGTLGLKAVHLKPSSSDTFFMERDLLQLSNIILARLIVPSKGRVLIDDRSTILKQFVRASCQGPGTSSRSIVKPSYEKIISFFVDKDLAKSVLSQCKNERVLYSMAGYSIGGKSYNCTTYATEILKRLGIYIPYQPRLGFSKFQIKEITRSSALKRFNTLKPLNYHELLLKYGVNKEEIPLNQV